MRARSLFLCAGAPLCRLAQEVLPPGGRGSPAYPTKAGSKRTKSSTQHHASISESSRSQNQPRELQLHLEDDSGADPMARSDVAYAALLMNDHDRGIRTLGQSLIDSRTSADLVAILGAGVTKVTETRMRAQGWRIRRLAVGGVDGDGGGVHKLDRASESVLAHASVWALTEYKRVVLLSDDMLVVENIDDLFLCEGICAAMQQAEVVSTSLIVLEPDLDIYQHMSRSVGTIYNFSNNFQGFLNTYLAGFETCALFDLENPCLQDPSTDPNRGPDAPLLDHSCHRLPTRYNGDLALVMLNGGLGMVRTKNAMPEEWWRQRRARVVRFEFAGLRPWMWFASPFLPFVSTWESTHLRAKPGDPTPSVFWVVLVWLAFVVAFLFCGRTVLVPVVSAGISKAEVPSKCAGGWRAWVPRALAWKRKRRGSSASSYNPRGLLWSLVHLAVGYSSLLCAVAVGLAQVPAASTVKMSWMVFITWTGTLFGTLWSAYLWFISRQPQLSPRAFMIGNGPLDLPNINTNLCPLPGGGGGSNSSTDPFKPKLAGGGSAAGSVLKVGCVVTPSPWRESVTSLALFVAVLAFLPAWKPMSGAASLPTLLVPAAVALVVMFVGLTVQMVRLPVLWCDRLKFLALMEKKGLRPCGSCGRVEC